MTLFSEVGLIRFSSLLWPAILLVLIVFWKPPSKRLAGAALISTLWNLFSLLILHLIAIHQQWWSYQAHTGLLLGMPADLLLGWALLWGAIPVLAFQDKPLWQPLILAFALDLLLMPFCAPVVILGNYWLLGEGVAVLIVLIPSLVLARCIQNKVSLILRTILLVIGFTGFTLFFIPSLILEQTGNSWSSALARHYQTTAIFLQIIFLVAAPALSAVQEFCKYGEGTPLPFDPPRRMITSGPYAYIANPMQFGFILILFIFGWWTSSLWISLTLLSVLCCSRIAAWQEEEELKNRFGTVWTLYRSEVRNWIPRWRPRILFPCKVYLSKECALCYSLLQWLQTQNPTGLEIIAAEKHPTKDLRRITYEAPGWSESGVLALARSLEHIHLGWAWIGWTIRLPIIHSVIQWLTDISGGGEREIKRK